MENLELTQEWDKVFPKSNKVDHQKITFHNRYGITLAADMYTPKNAAGKLSAIAVSGPFGAVKESDRCYRRICVRYPRKSDCTHLYLHRHFCRGFRKFHQTPRS